MMPFWPRIWYRITAGTFLAYAFMHLGGIYDELNALSRTSLITCNPQYIYYTYDGSCNNIHNPKWARAGTPYNRLIPANYSSIQNRECPIRNSTIGKALPLVRQIRASLTESKVYSDNNTALYYAFSQWVNYDINRFMPMKIPKTARCCKKNSEDDFQSSHNCLPVSIPKNDELHLRLNVSCIDLMRVNNTHAIKVHERKPCVPINFQTGLLDLSILYGNDYNTVQKMRRSPDGKLKCIHHLHEDLTNFLSVSSAISNIRSCAKHKGDCSKIDNSKLDKDPEIMLMGALFHRIHNKIASMFDSGSNERIFQESRRLLIAVYQHVIFNEYVPATLGLSFSKRYKLLPLREGRTEYAHQVNPQTPVEYSLTVGRIAPTLINGNIDYKVSMRRNQSHSKHEKSHHAGCVAGELFRHSIESYILGLQIPLSEHVAEKMTKHLSPISDIKLVIDILRGLDGGLPTYNDARRKFGLRRFNKFEDLGPEIIATSDSKIVETLKKLYPTVDDIDLYVGGFLERPLNSQSIVGPTFANIFKETFYRLKFGDRLHYEFPSSNFTATELAEIRKVKFSYLICLTIPEKTMPITEYVFLKPSASNPMVDCQYILENGPNLRMLKKSTSYTA